MGPKVALGILAKAVKGQPRLDVPRTRPVNERCVTDCGGDAEFMKESFARDMLYSSTASKTPLGRVECFFE